MVDDDVHHLPLVSGRTGLDDACAWRIREFPRVTKSDQESIVAEYSVLPEFLNRFFCLAGTNLASVLPTNHKEASSILLYSDWSNR